MAPPKKWFLHWEPNEGSSVSSEIVLEARFCIKENFNGVKEGRWGPSSMRYFKPKSQDPSKRGEFAKEFIGIGLGDEPSKRYYVIRREKLIVEADSSMQLIINRLNSYQSGLSFVFEGFQYKAGDFRVRIGHVDPHDTHNTVGLVMEVDYLPRASMERTKKVMEEFVDKWQEEMSKRSQLGKFVNRTVKFEEFGLAEDKYTSRHAAVQYAYFLARLLKKDGDERAA